MARITIEVDSKGAVKNVQDLEGAFGRADAKVEKLDKDVKTAGKSLRSSFNNRIKNQIGGLFAGLALGAASVGFVRIADEMTSVSARVKIITKDTDDFRMSMEALFQISQTTGSQLGSNAASFARLNGAITELGGNSKDTLLIVETMNKAFVANGSTGEETASVMLQFAQAMGSGKLQGEELRAVLEGNAFFARELAVAMGTNIAGLRDMAAAGELTTKKLVDAFPKIKKSVDEAFNQIPVTVSRSLTEVNNAFKQSIGIINEQQGATSKLAGNIQGVARAIENNQAAISGFAEGLAVLTRAGIETFSGLSKWIGISVGNGLYWASFLQQGFESAFLAVELIATKAFYNIAKASNDAVISAIKLLNKLPKVNIEVPSSSTEALDSLKKKIKETGDEILAIDDKYTTYRKSVKEQALEQAKALADQIKGFKKVLKPVKDTANEQKKTETIIKKVNGIWISTQKSVTAETKKTGEEISKVGSKWDGEADRIVANNKKIQDSIDSIKSKLQALGSNPLPGAASSSGSNTRVSGARARGGPVHAGQTYMVGENEPELFTPKTSGTISNQAQMGSQTSGYMEIDLSFGGEDRVKLLGTKNEVMKLQRRNELNRRFASA